MTKEYDVVLTNNHGKVIMEAQSLTLTPNIIEKRANNLPLEIGFKRLSENAVLPTKANPSDSGLDLYAAEDVIIAPGETAVVKTNLAVQLPPGYEAQVRPRSGITSKTKLRVQLGTIDESYRGDIGIIIDNISTESLRTQSPPYTKYMRYIDNTVVPPTIGDYHVRDTYLIRKGDKIAQLVVQPIPQTVAVEIAELDDTDRGGNGFGSSGV